MRKLISILLVVLGICIVVDSSNAIQLNFNSINMDALSGNFSNVHFNGAGNNFWGGIFWFNTKSLQAWSEGLIAIKKNGVSIWNEKLCNKVVRGIYYNSQRGNRIRPLDSQTLDLLKSTNSSYNWLTMDGGLYTSCSGTDNKYSIFWAITYTQHGTVSYVIAGTKLTYAKNAWSGEFAQSFQYFDNKTPLGYIWDSYGGIGFVGGDLSGGNNLITFLDGWGNINSGFTYANTGTIIVANPGAGRTFSGVGNSAINTMWNLIIQGTIGLTNNLNTTDKESLVGNQKGNSTIFNSSITNADISNQAKQYSEKLCKWRRQTLSNDTGLTTDPSVPAILCYKGASTYTVTIDTTKESTYQNKTIIMQNGNILLTGKMTDSSPSLDLYIDAGNMYVTATWATNNATSFDAQGFPVTSNGASAGRFIKGNIIINGLLIGRTPNGITAIQNKTHIQGKFFSLNTPFEPTVVRKTQIGDLFWWTTQYDNYISLQKVFTRECNLGTGSDGTSCLYGNDIWRVPLVILDRAFPSRLLK